MPKTPRQFSTDSRHDGIAMLERSNRTFAEVADALRVNVHTLKKNELLRRQQFTDREALLRALFEYIEVFYDRQRLHSALHYRTPADVELAFVTANAA